MKRNLSLRCILDIFLKFRRGLHNLSHSSVRELCLRAVHKRGKSLLAGLKQKCAWCVNIAKAANRTMDFFLQFVPKIGDVLPASLTITVFCVSSRVSKLRQDRKGTTFVSVLASKKK